MSLRKTTMTTKLMMLNARVEPAKRLKRIIAAISGVERYGRMSIQEDSLFLEVMNPNHNVPVSLFLASPWFQSYNFISFTAKGNPNSTCTILLDLTTLNHLLSLADDDDQVEIHALSDSDFNRFHFFFDAPEKGLRCHEMLFWRTLTVDMRRLRDMENAYARGFIVAVPPHHFTHVLQRSMLTPSPVNIDITSSMMMISFGATIRFLEQDLQCGIRNFPKDGLVSLQLYLHGVEYLLEAASIGKSVVIKVANPQLPPSISIPIEHFASLHLLFPFNSAVQPQITRWSS